MSFARATALMKVLEPQLKESDKQVYADLKRHLTGKLKDKMVSAVARKDELEIEGAA
jgi:hypothetical protein